MYRTTVARSSYAQYRLMTTSYITGLVVPRYLRKTNKQWNLVDYLTYSVVQVQYISPGSVVGCRRGILVFGEFCT